MEKVDTDYLPSNQAREMTQEAIDEAMPKEPDPAVTEEETTELPKFEEDEIVECGGFSFEVTRVMGPCRYLIKVVD